MGYRIEYGQTAKREAINELAIFKSKKATVCTTIVLVSIVIVLFCIGFKPIRTFLLPGDPEITNRALNTFADQIRAGDPFDEAAAAFCHEIITGADVP